MTLFEDYRQFYADEIRLAANLRSKAVADAFARVPREHFLGPGPWQICSGEQAALALMGLGGMYTPTTDPRDLYHNVLVAIDPSRHLNNGHPSTLARWIDALDLADGDRVYHVGCGVGYYTAILAEAVGPQGQVVAIDVDANLAARAKQNLASYPQVTVHAGDGALFQPGACDAILINAGVTHPHPPWLENLSDGGRLVLPLTASMGENHGTGVMARITRKQAEYPAQAVSFVSIFSSTSVRDAELEAPLRQGLSDKSLLKLKSVRLDPHEKADTCLVHGRAICLSSSGTTL